MQNIVICTIGSKTLNVLISSLQNYLPSDVNIFLFGSDVKINKNTFNFLNNSQSFGEAYNIAVNQIFKDYEDVVVCSDDIVLDPTSWEILKEDVAFLKSSNKNIGWVAARSNQARGFQNIRWSQHDDILKDKYDSEQKILKSSIIAPFFAYISKEAWVDFLPINWYSDDIQCDKIIKNGFENFISRSYVHHVGYQSATGDFSTNKIKSLDWLLKNNFKEFNNLNIFAGG